MPEKRIVLTGVGHIPRNPGWHIKWQRHEFSELIVVLAGCYTLRWNPGEEIMEKAMKAGDVAVYPAGCYHEETSDPDDPVETIFISFTGYAGKTVDSAHDTEGRVRTLARWLYGAQVTTYERMGELRQAWFIALIEEFRRLGAPSTAVNALIENARACMRNHLSSNISLDDLAKTASLSKHHYCRAYRAACGRTPMQDLRLMRLDDAMNLLRTTSLPLKAIAPMVGLANEFHLSRALKKYLGESVKTARAG